MRISDGSSDVCSSDLFAAAATVIQWHVFGMFFPSFFTGNLIARFGALQIIIVGTMLNLVCIGVTLSGIEVMNFQLSLLLLGVRSEERRVGKECVIQFRSWWQPSH